MKLRRVNGCRSSQLSPPVHSNRTSRESEHLSANVYWLMAAIHAMDWTLLLCQALHVPPNFACTVMTTIDFLVLWALPWTGTCDYSLPKSCVFNCRTTKRKQKDSLLSPVRPSVNHEDSSNQPLLGCSTLLQPAPRLTGVGQHARARRPENEF